MNYLRLVFAWVLCASPALVQAQNGIQILSQYYHINASWNETWYDGNGQPYPLGDWSAGYSSYPMTGGYDQSSSDGSPVSATTAAPGPTGGSAQSASASIGLFSVQNNAQAGKNYILTGMGLQIGGQEGGTTTSIEADWFFSPSGNSLDASINVLYQTFYGFHYGFPSAFTVTLSDTTASTTLLSINPDSSNFSSSGDYPFAVNPSDVYEFSISGSEGANDSDFIDLNVSASITSVPEPRVCWLLSSGLAGLLGFKCRTKIMRFKIS